MRYTYILYITTPTFTMDLLLDYEDNVIPFTMQDNATVSELYSKVYDITKCIYTFQLEYITSEYSCSTDTYSTYVESVLDETSDDLLSNVLADFTIKMQVLCRNDSCIVNSMQTTTTIFDNFHNTTLDQNHCSDRCVKYFANYKLNKMLDDWDIKQYAFLIPHITCIDENMHKRIIQAVMNYKIAPSYLRYIELIESEQSDIVNVIGTAIRYIKQPSPDIQLKSIAQNANSIEYIQNPTAEMQFLAVKKDPCSIMHIANPSIEIQLTAIKKSNIAVKYIKNITEPVLIRAMLMDPWTIELVQNPSEEVQLAAVRKCGIAIQHIDNPTETVKLEALKNDPLAVHFMNNPLPEYRYKCPKRECIVVRLLKSIFEPIRKQLTTNVDTVYFHNK